MCLVFALQHFEGKFTENYRTNKIVHFLVILRATLSHLLHPTLINLLSPLYCDLCHRYFASLSNIKSSVNKCPPHQFQDDYQMQILKKRGQSF